MSTRKKCLSLVFAMILTVAGWGQDATDSKSTRQFGANVKASHDITSMSPAYRHEALGLLVAEANRIAEALKLPENLPICETNLLASYITPPQLVRRLESLGNITTSKYEYYCSVGKKFSFLTRTGLEREYAKLRKEWRLPMSQIDTNAAYQLAVTWLSEASMDVESLNRDCIVEVLAYTPEGDKGNYFVPVYWVYWTKGTKGRGSVASVELFAPKKVLLQLRVEEAKYILRQPLQVTNFNQSLSGPNKR